MPIPLLLSLVSLLGNGEAPQWGSFRGNNGAGLCAGAKLPEALDPEGTLMWRVDVPGGYSSPVIAQKNLYLTGVSAKPAGGTVSGKLVTLCLDAFTGDMRWKKELDFSGARPGQNSSAAPSPVTDGEVVVALFHHLGLVAYDAQGKELWKQPIGPFNIPHGMSTSPLLYKDLVVLQVDQDAGAYLVAYDRKSGKQVWRTDRPGVTHSYATPAIWQPASGAPQVIVSGTFQIAGYALESGAKTWWVDGSGWMTKCIPIVSGNRCFVNSFSPSLSDMEYPSFSGTFEEALALHDAADKDGKKDGKIAKSEYGNEQLHTVWFLFDLDNDDLLDKGEWGFAIASNDARGGLFAIDLDGKGDVTKSKVAWRNDDKRGLSNYASPLLVGDSVFMIDDGGLLTSFDAKTGKVVRQERVGQPDQYYASPVTGDGKIYLASLGGVLSVVSAEPEWKELASHHLEDEVVWATPALAGKSVYVRGKEALYCFEQPE